MNNTGVMLSSVLYIKALLPASTGFHLLKQRGKWSHYLHSVKNHMVTHGHPARGGLQSSLCAQFKSKMKSLYYMALASGKEGEQDHEQKKLLSLIFFLSSCFRVTLSISKTTTGIRQILLYQQLLLNQYTLKPSMKTSVLCKRHNNFILLLCINKPKTNKQTKKDKEYMDTFVLFCFLLHLTLWWNGLVWDFTAGKFKAEMRTKPAQRVIIYHWGLSFHRGLSPPSPMSYRNCSWYQGLSTKGRKGCEG